MKSLSQSFCSLQLTTCLVAALGTGISAAQAADASVDTQAQPGLDTPSTQVETKAEEIKPTAKFNALLQAWTLYDSTAPTVKTNTRLRRAEVKASGSALPGTRWFVMGDLAKSLGTTAGTDGKILQDLGVGINLIDSLELVVGQFKLPLMAEGIGPSSEILFPERSAPTRAYGDKREPGAMLTYKYDFLKVSLMGSNGQAANVDDTSNGKDLSARAEAAWLDRKLSLGAFSLFGDGATQNRTRFGANLGWNADGLLVRTEFVANKGNGNKKTNGYVVEAGYTFAEKYQPVARFASLKNKGASFSSNEETIGFNYYLAKNFLKVQAGWAFLQNMNGNNGTPVATAAKSKKGNAFVTAFQSSY